MVQPLDLAIAQACNEVSYNLNGQRLGRKGRETRERIVRAAIDALGEGGEEPFTLSAVARRASLGMSSLYNYFTDLSELMVAVLEPVMASAHIDYLALLDDYWPDDELGARCQQFWCRYVGSLAPGTGRPRSTSNNRWRACWPRCSSGPSPCRASPAIAMSSAARWRG